MYKLVVFLLLAGIFYILFHLPHACRSFIICEVRTGTDQLDATGASLQESHSTRLTCEVILKTKETFELAVQSHQKNNLQVAENLYKEVLKENPEHVESISLLGTLLAQTKRYDLAKNLLQKVNRIWSLI